MGKAIAMQKNCSNKKQQSNACSKNLLIEKQEGVAVGCKAAGSSATIKNKARALGIAGDG